MVRAEQKPGRRRAEPTRRLRRPTRPPKATKPPASLPQTTAEPPAEKPEKPAPPRRPKSSRQRRPKPALRRRLLVGLWFTLFTAGVVAVALPWTSVDVPRAVPLAGAVTLTTLFTHALGVRTGGRPLLAGGLALVLSGAAAVSQSPVLLAGAAVGTAVVAAVVAVLATIPAARFSQVVREVVVAGLLAATGALAVHAYDAEVSLERTNYLVLGFSLLGALVLVYRLGAGLQGLGRRGFVMIVSGVALLTVTLAYTEALAHWGSQGMIDSADQLVESVRSSIGAMPRPIEVLLGFPALAWGVSTRARRRQGWWVSAFGAAGLAAVSVSLLHMGLLEAGLSLLYSLVLGLAVGYAVIRADLFLTGARGRRARRLEELAAHRPEPGRLHPLL